MLFRRKLDDHRVRMPIGGCRRLPENPPGSKSSPKAVRGRSLPTGYAQNPFWRRAPGQVASLFVKKEWPNVLRVADRSEIISCAFFSASLVRLHRLVEKPRLLRLQIGNFARRADGQ